MISAVPNALLALLLVQSPLEISGQEALQPISGSIELSQSIDSKPIEGDLARLIQAGRDRFADGDYLAAAEQYQLALAHLRTQSNIEPLMEIDLLHRLGSAYLRTGFLSQAERNMYYDLAIATLDEALTLVRDLPSEGSIAPSVEGSSEPDATKLQIGILEALGVIYHEKNQLAVALDYYNQAIAITPPDDQARTLSNMSILQTILGQYLEAETALKKATLLYQQEGNVCEEASNLSSLGRIYARQENYVEAIAHYQKAITLYQNYEERNEDDCSDVAGREIRAFTNLTSAYIRSENYSAAAEAIEEAFSLLDLADNARERAILLVNEGALHQKQGNFEQSWSTTRQGLQIMETDQNKLGKINGTLSLAELMEAREQPALAIFFYKQAISEIETLRSDIQQLSTKIQEQFTRTVEDDYRHLANLLLQQNRVAEALQILELLKLEEIDAFLHSDSDRSSSEAVPNTAAEAALLARLNELPDNISLTDFIQLPEVIALTETQSPPGNRSQSTQNSDIFQLQSIEQLQKILSSQPPSTAVLYPLLLEDRLELILILPNGSLIHRTTQVTKAELSQTVRTLQSQLSEGILDIKPEARKLHGWLMGELEPLLIERGIENIIYLPDDALRYVPIAVLFDGEEWFAEKYQSHNITAVSVGNLSQSNPPTKSVLAGAFTDSMASHTVKVGQQSYVLEGLEFARQEIEKVKASLPNTIELIDRQFSSSNLLSALAESPSSGFADGRIVHLATHAKFIPGQPEDSFILFGDGDTANLRDIGEWALDDVDLIVFSACQTAMGTEADGKEFLGLGFQVQEAGAKAAIASLWSVRDDATAVLMNQFYIAIADGQSKAQALRTAQEEMIKSQHFNDPHDWAAFVLIGNGL